LDLYTKVDAEATAPAAFDEVKIETKSDPNTGNLTVTVHKNGQTQNVVVPQTELVESLSQGLSSEQIIDRVAKTLIIALDREANDIPF
jgi:hypothetical protein